MCSNIVDMVTSKNSIGFQIHWNVMFIPVVVFLSGTSSPARAQDEREHLNALAESFSACSFDWQAVKKFGLLNKCLLPAQFSRATCGKILLHCTEVVTCFRQKIGIRI